MSENERQLLLIINDAYQCAQQYCGTHTVKANMVIELTCTHGCDQATRCPFAARDLLVLTAHSHIIEAVQAETPMLWALAWGA